MKPYQAGRPTNDPVPSACFSRYKYGTSIANQQQTFFLSLLITPNIITHSTLHFTSQSIFQELPPKPLQPTSKCSPPSKSPRLSPPATTTVATTPSVLSCKWVLPPINIGANGTDNHTTRHSSRPSSRGSTPEPPPAATATHPRRLRSPLDLKLQKSIRPLVRTRTQRLNQYANPLHMRLSTPRGLPRVAADKQAIRLGTTFSPPPSLANQSSTPPPLMFCITHPPLHIHYNSLASR